MKNEAVGFIDDLFNNRNPRWLTLLGPAGIGKTMLAKRIWHLFRDHRHGAIDWERSKETEKKGCKGRVIRWRGGFLNWGSAVNDRMLQGDFDFLRDVAQHDFFALDDLISEYEKHRELSASKLYYVLERRLGKWTVLTANVTVEQMGDLLDPRISSRLIRGGSVVVDVDTEDYNLRSP